MNIAAKHSSLSFVKYRLGISEPLLMPVGKVEVAATLATVTDSA
jgi:hypothetical protein